jgi:hypothetical protein
MKSNELLVIGRNTLIEFIGHAKNVPTKVDTGADSSSVWATNINVDKEGVLSFTLFGKASTLYTGEVITRKDFRVAKVRSSSGHEEIRYRTKIPIRISGKRIKVSFYLSDRSTHTYPVLLGRRTLNKRFIVDVSRKDYEEPPKVRRGLYEEMIKNPHEFHKKHHNKGNSR